MRASAILLTLPLLAALAGCNPESRATGERPIRSVVVIPKRWNGSPVPVIALPRSALFEKNGAAAVWVFNRPSGSVVLKPVTVARYEADTVIIGSGVATGEIVVTAGISMLRQNQKAHLAAPASMP
jgi:multidrug efflux pump subunit AcrA (membrane-fusion protein)